MQPLRRDPYEVGLALSAQARHGEAIGAYEAALAERPNDVRVLFALGNTARALDLPGPAEEFFRRVLALEPGRLEALVNLANLLRAQGNHAGARALLEPAAARFDDAAELHVALGTIQRELGAREQAQACYREALRRDLDNAAALGNLADMLADDGDIDAAMALYDRAVVREPKNAQLKLNRAVLNLLQGNLKDGWRDYAARLKVPGKAPVCEHGLKPWTGGPLKRTRLLVTAEQGVGDQLMFASMFPELLVRARTEGGSVVIECEKRLVPLFARSFASATVHAAEMEAKGAVVMSRYGWLKHAGGANAAIEMGTLPRFLRASREGFPRPHVFLVPDAGEHTLWRQRLAAAGPAPYIGICWRSGKRGGLRDLQFAPPAAWADGIRNLPGTIVSVQYDASPEEVATLSSLSGRNVFVPPGLDQKNELDRTCAMLAALDCVLSAPTAVSWLAAGAGVPTLKILFDTSWTSFGETHEPFAPACICLSPHTRGDWADVFGHASTQLSALRKA